MDVGQQDTTRASAVLSIPAMKECEQYGEDARHRLAVSPSNATPTVASRDKHG
jgi:hypothetical protein